MKSLCASLLTILIIICALLASAGELAAFPADLTRGDIRCVLMSVSQTTIFPNKEDRDLKQKTWGGTTNGVPCFTVTYLVEQLGDVPSAPFFGGGIELICHGSPLRLGSDGYQKCFDYGVFQSFLDFGKPKVANPNRAVIMQSVSFGSVPDLQPMSLTITAGFGKDLQQFRFESIRPQ